MLALDKGIFGYTVPINCYDQKSLNHHSEAFPCVMNQLSCGSGTLYSADMPFLQVR